MKSSPRVLLRFCSLLLLVSPALSAQVGNSTQLPALLRQSGNDSLRKIERLAALQFHVLINEYRVSQNLDALAWDDTLWLASRNHCEWMESNDELSHQEKANTKSFTGKDPGDRYAFVKNNKNASGAWSAENALYNYSAGGSTIADIAKNIAQYSLNQWKHSPGHNANMLGKSSRSHGVAFLIVPGGRVWSTDLFSWQAGSQQKSSINTSVILASGGNETTPSQTTTAKQVKKNGMQSASAKYVKLDLASTSADLSAALYQQQEGMKRSKAMEKAAYQHALYIAGTKKLVHEEKKGRRNFYGTTVEKRMRKASRGRYAFAKRHLKVTENIVLAEADAAALDVPALATEINEKLGNDPNNTPFDSVGYGIVIKRVKNILSVYVVRVSGSHH